MTRNRPGDLTDMRVASLDAAEQSLVDKNFKPYLRLKELLHKTTGEARAEFRQTFKAYYGMRPGTGASAEFDERFFETLFRFQPLANSGPDFTEIVAALAPIKNPRGRPSLQFSFVSKLVAIHHEDRPIYDKHVRTFFGKPIAPYQLDPSARIAHVAEFLAFVAECYEVWSHDPRLAAILERLRNRDPRLADCSPIRLIDFLVWRVGNLAQKKSHSHR